MMTVVPTVSPAVSTLRRPVPLFLVAGILVFGLPLLVSCRLDQLLSPGAKPVVRLRPDTVGVAETKPLPVTVTVAGQVQAGMPLTFTSSNTTIATVDQSGGVLGVKRGKAAITAQIPGVEGVDRAASATDTVWVVADSVSLDPGDTTLTTFDDEVCYAAKAYNKNGVALSDRVDTITIISDPDTTLSPESTFGCFRARKNGRAATIEARVDTARAQATVTVALTAPLLAVSPGARTDTAFEGSTAPRSSVIRISNAGGAVLSWTAAADSAWIGLSKSSGTVTVPPNNNDSTTLTLDPSGLVAGSHTGHVVVTATGATGSPDTVTTTLVIIGCTVRALTPDTLEQGTLTAADCGAPHRAGSLARVYSVNASPGDTIDAALSAAFDAYLVVTDDTGKVLLSNNDCSVSTTSACVRNVVVPANGMRIEATTAVSGATGSFSLSVTKPRPPGGPGGLDQFMANGLTQIASGGTDTTSSVVFKGTVTDPNPRDTLRLQVELRFAGASNFTGSPTDSSAPVTPSATATVTHTGLTDDTVYHWKARTCDQTGRCSAWADFGANADPATDFRVAVPQDPFVPTDTIQSYPSPGGQIALGGPDTTGTIVFKATVSDPDPGDTLAIQVERQPAGTGTFTDLPNLPNGTRVAAGMISSLTVTGQPDSASYIWRVRTIDQTGRTSGWVDFGGNGVAADYKIDLPKPPGLPAGLGQFLADGTTPISVGGGTGGGLGSTQTVVFKATVTDPNIGDSIAIEVEAKTTDVTFDGTGVTRGTGVLTNGTASVSIGYTVGLLAANYLWRARACDRTNRCSGWVAFSGNTDRDPSSGLNPSDTDFHVP